jgi:hypothetical protein
MYPTRKPYPVLAAIFILASLSALQSQEYDWAAIDEEGFEKTQPTELPLST